MVIISIIAVILLTILIVWAIDNFIPKKFKTPILISLWAIIIFLGYITFMSVYGEIQFNQLKEKRYKIAIENLKVIKSNIIGKNHIKSILIGSDGSIIKSIAFNAKDSPLESFLDKKNKKKFSIAGKMNLNDWKGNKSVQFIIEDISL